MKWIKRYLTLSLVLLGACSGLPKEMRNAAYIKVDLNEVKKNSSTYEGMPFRWGGSIIEVTNKEKSSQAQILYYPINSYDRPSLDKETQGRFAITRTQFLDPAIYKEGTEVTVSGILTGETKQQIGEKILTLPLLLVDHIYVWPKLQQFDDRFNYYPYSPYYYYPFPYYRHNFFYNTF